jgi:hypothetical protein
VQSAIATCKHFQPRLRVCCASHCFTRALDHGNQIDHTMALMEDHLANLRFLKFK